MDRLGGLLADAVPPDTPEGVREHAALLNRYDRWRATLETAGTAEELVPVYAEVFTAQRRAARWQPR